MDFLLSKDVDVNFRNECNESCLSLACGAVPEIADAGRPHSWQVVRRLLRSGVNSAPRIEIADDVSDLPSD